MKNIPSLFDFDCTILLLESRRLPKYQPTHFFGFLSCLVSSWLLLAQPCCRGAKLVTIVSDEWREINSVTAALFEQSERSLMQATAY